MAVVQVNSGYNFYGPSTGNMASPNFSGWNYASIGLGGTTATLQPLGPQDFGSLTTLTLSGTNLSITPNVIVAAISTGPDLGLRVATGTVQSLQYIAGASASHGSISTSYSIPGLNVGFQTLLNNSAAPLAYLLSGNDEVLGSSYHDILEGYAGNDILRPGFSNYYPSTYDVVDGGVGTDTISFSDISLGVTVNLTTGLATGGNPNIAPRVNAHLISIENATGGSGNDILIGSAVANVLSGGAGNDHLYGGAGNDTLLGGIGNDILRGDAGADIINGGDGIDRADYTTSTVSMTINLTNGTASDGDTLTGIENVYGSVSNDVIIGSMLANVLYGNNGNDQLFGLAGNDNLNGQNGDDALFGGDGNDYAFGGEGNDGLFGDAGNDTLFGGNGNDYIAGGDGNDVIWGDAGNDQIDAGAGNDFVVLGAGDDIFTLGAGDDRIRFDYGNGIDTIRDFGNGADILDFTATNMTLAALQANTVETSQGVLMNLGSGSILLEGLHLWQIEWNSDFVFGV